jgi:hypothetical protein
MEELRGAGEEGFTLIELLVVVLLPLHKQPRWAHSRPN